MCSNLLRQSNKIRLKIINVAAWKHPGNKILPSCLLGQSLHHIALCFVTQMLSGGIKTLCKGRMIKLDKTECITCPCSLLCLEFPEDSVSRAQHLAFRPVQNSLNESSIQRLAWGDHILIWQSGALSQSIFFIRLLINGNTVVFQHDAVHSRHDLSESIARFCHLHRCSMLFISFRQQLLLANTLRDEVI